MNAPATLANLMLDGQPVALGHRFTSDEAHVAGRKGGLVRQEKLRTARANAEPELVRTCAGCGQIKPLADFYRSSRAKDRGYYSRCKVCKNKEHRLWCALNPGAEAARDLRRRHRDIRGHLLRSARSRARKAGLPFDLAREDIIVPERCPLLGIPLVVRDGKHRADSPSLDRIEAAKGYVRGNVWVISHRANTIKSDATWEELMLIASGLRVKVRP